MRVHNLKLNIKYWKDIKSGAKPFELRLNDRDYKIGDEIVFKMIDNHGLYKTRHNHDTDTTEPMSIRARITYFIQDETFLQRGYCVFGIIIIKEDI